jgi:NitT/TauT family transport system substrate-binding protein
LTIGRQHTCTIAAALVLFAGNPAARAEPLFVAYSVWPGFGPFFLAQEKGFFEDEGLDVQMIAMEETMWEGLYDGEVDAILNAMDTVVSFYDPDQKPVCVMALDESLGGDGIVALNEIKEVADLKGRTIAFNDGDISEFFLNVLLQEAGLSAKDIEPVPLPAEDAIDAFLSGEVDAAVVWDPFLTQGAEAEHGHRLIDSSNRPGLLIDCLITKASLFEQRKRDFQGLARGWAAAVEYYQGHPAEAIEIMARYVGGDLEDDAAFAAMLESSPLYGREASKAYLGTPEHPGPIYDTAQKAIDVWSSLGRLHAVITPADIIGHGIWDQ